MPEEAAVIRVTPVAEDGTRGATETIQADAYSFDPDYDPDDETVDPDRVLVTVTTDGDQLRYPLIGRHVDGAYVKGHWIETLPDPEPDPEPVGDEQPDDQGNDPDTVRAMYNEAQRRADEAAAAQRAEQPEPTDT